MLRGAAADLSGARWAGLPADCERRRLRLIAEVAAAVERLSVSVGR